MDRETSHEVGASVRWADRATPIVGFLAILATIAHTFSSQSVVHFRDLAHYSLPFTQWMRRTIAGGHLPLWNGDSGLGFSAISDPTLQLLFPPTLLLRLLLPESLGLNLSVSIAIPVAYVGALLLLCRRADIGIATTGALVFAISGPMVSAANMLNLGWSAALAPWVVLAALRTAESTDLARIGQLAIAVALQALAGEPMTLAATIATAIAVSAADAPAGRAAGLARIGGGMMLGIALACVQLVPLVEASFGSARGSGMLTDSWSTHPASLLETVLPGLFGSPLNDASISPAWYRALNGGRDPLLLSVFVGLPALAIAAASIAGRERRVRMTTLVWIAVLVASIVLAMGDYAPVLPALRDHVPGGSMARFPSKFLCIAALALAALICAGIEALVETPRNRAGLIAGLCVAGVGFVLALIAVSLGSEGSSSPTIAGWAAVAGIPRSDVTILTLASGFAQSGRSLLVFALLTGVALAFVPALQLSPRLKYTAFGVLVVLPLLLVWPARLLPTLERSRLERPEWLSALNTGGRVFVSAGDGLAYSPDVSPDFPIPPGTSRAGAGSIYGSSFPVYPTGLGVRDAITTDLAALRPQSYTLLVDRFAAATPAERRRALARLGVTDLIVPFEPMPPNAAFERRFDRLQAMAHWRIPDASPRLTMVESAEHHGSSTEAISRLFAESFDPSVKVLVETPSEESSFVGASSVAEGDRVGALAPIEPSTMPEVLAESPSTLIVRATCSTDGGWLVVNDAWANGWVATVDNVEAPMLRANGVVRAVPLSRGEHTVRLSYRPRSLFVGAGISGAAGLIVAVLLYATRYRRRQYRASVQAIPLV